MKNNNTQLSVFNFQESEVRIVIIDNEPCFVAKDLCNVLGINNHIDAVSRLDDDERGSVLVDTPGGNQVMSIVSESGMYSLVLKSRKKQAKVFKKWITSEVLPSIRKTGQYSIEQKIPTTGDVLQAMVSAFKQHEQRLSVIEQENIILKQQLAEQQEVVESVEMLAEANSCELERFRNSHGCWYSVVGYATKYGLGSYSVKTASALGRKATALCKRMGIVPEKINDPRFGMVNTYPEHILAKIV
ncbi:Bro-N domain-containing protein [Okeania sp. KiyG1]|uniref:BRO-N domain-containing protein n=1 Tax=Okeania sp. KiyG1 TaxID=2720165 RepID=UPI0019220EEA|nr:Bro-N domain-containing protein [Okeania sp. KiyG1]GGA02430.1 hypothetical protein CYANOKiyG1_14490 [Okeania sp. KiyG1]GGA11558.1 hypothetical protein CYANOKiyG1_24550 [Okeania sp. KiyG1]GGA18484.1 hypothetical protein CYANOKiyG1_32960 [Okeania sp. KiyG1]